MRQYERYLPTRAQLREIRSLRFLGDLIFAPNLWHFNRHSVSYGCLIGFFCCFLPMPFQMVPATLLSVWLGCNIPLTIALVWVSNPITVPPLFYFCYRIGCWMMGEPQHVQGISLSVQWLVAELSAIWQPLLLGSLTCGITFGITAFIIVRVYWRWRVQRDWNSRRLSRSRVRRRSAA